MISVPKMADSNKHRDQDFNYSFDFITDIKN